MANVTTTIVDSTLGFVPDVLDLAIQESIKDKLVMLPLTTSYTGMIQGKSDTLLIKKYAAASTRTKAANTDVTTDTPTNSTVTLSIDTHEYIAMEEEDSAKSITQIDVMRWIQMEAAPALAKSIDKSLFDLYSEATNSVAAAAHTGADFKADLLSVHRYLNEANTPDAGRVLVVSPAMLERALGVEQIASLNYSPDRPLVNGAIGRFLGFDWYVTNAPGYDTSSGTDTYQALAFHPMAIGYAFSIAPRVQVSYQLQSIANLAVADAMWGVKEINPDFMCSLSITE